MFGQQCPKGLNLGSSKAIAEVDRKNFRQEKTKKQKDKFVFVFCLVDISRFPRALNFTPVLQIEHRRGLSTEESMG